MGAPRLAIRIVGFALNPHGIAFAVVEDADWLLDCGSRKPASRGVTAAIEEVLERYQPLFVACEMGRASHRSARARQFEDALLGVCAKRGLMILCVERIRLAAEGRRYPTNYEVSLAAAERFPRIGKRVPTKRRLWEGANDSLGVFLAAASAAAGWDHFRKSRTSTAVNPRM